MKYAMKFDDESKSMLGDSQPVPSTTPQTTAAAFEMDMENEASPALDSRSIDIKLLIPPRNSPLWILYINALGASYFRGLVCLALIGVTGFMVSPGVSPTVLPFAAYSLVCVWAPLIIPPSPSFTLSAPLTHPQAIIHVLLVIWHRSIKLERMTPPWHDVAVFVASLAMFLAVIAYGSVVIALTKQHYDERDMSRTIRCGGKSRSGRRCNPKTHDAQLYDCTIAAVVLGCFAL